MESTRGDYRWVRIGEQPMPLSIGTRLGPYEILAPIGAGGMGEVYRARDTRLDRTVAVKVSKEQFSERFQREARAIAQLNHPHICQLHDVGPNYLGYGVHRGRPAQGAAAARSGAEVRGSDLRRARRRAPDRQSSSCTRQVSHGLATRPADANHLITLRRGSSGASQVVLDPELIAGLLEEGLDGRSRGGSLVHIEFKSWKAVQGGL
jgi:serine/threonine protein kinase